MLPSKNISFERVIGRVDVYVELRSVPDKLSPSGKVSAYVAHTIDGERVITLPPTRNQIRYQQVISILDGMSGEGGR